MKNTFKFLMAAAALLLVVNANAQLGIKAGYLSTKGREKDNGAKEWNKSRPVDGFKFGVDYDFRFGHTGWSIRPGVFYNFFGENEGDKVYTGKYRSHFLSIPVDMKYNFNLGKGWGIYIFTGPRLVAGLAGTSVIEGNGIKETYNVYTGKATIEEEGEDTVKANGLAEFNRFDLQIGTGLGFKYLDFSCELGYDWGLLNTVKYDRKNNEYKRNQLGVTVGYAF